MGIIQKKVVLVTGSAGFIGKQLVKELQERNFEVLGFDRGEGDISSAKLDFHRLDHVFHLASMVYVPLSWEDPFQFYKTNLLGTINVLELCRKTGCGLTYVSSYIYGIPQYLPVDELHPVNPGSPYNHSKLLAEDACRFYASSFRVPVMIFRPVNIYGPGQNSLFLIPSIIQQVCDPGKSMVEVSDLRPRRDYLYITDFTDALINNFGRNGFHLYNIGSGISISVEEIIRTVMLESGISKQYVATGKERTNEIWDVYTDIRKLYGETGWKPAISFTDGIRKCIGETGKKS